MERLVTSLVVETDQPFQEQKENIGFAISCPKENATDQAFRSAGQTKDGSFYVGDVDIPASGMFCKVQLLYRYEINTISRVLLGAVNF